MKRALLILVLCTSFAFLGCKKTPDSPPEVSVKTVRKAAEQGDAAAQYNLGGMYYKGEGVTQDSEEAAKWIRKAAEQGQAEAQNDLGGMYFRGEGVTQDYKEAFEWSRKAAEQGNGKAQNNLGLMYESGKGVDEDTVQAYKWLLVAGVNGHYNDQGIRLLEGSMTAEQIAEGRRLANEYLEQKKLEEK